MSQQLGKTHPFDGSVNQGITLFASSTDLDESVNHKKP